MIKSPHTREKMNAREMFVKIYVREKVMSVRYIVFLSSASNIYQPYDFLASKLKTKMKTE